jgi:hypothetical protein
MERSLAGMLFLVAGVALAVSAGAWWMQRIVFTPDDHRDTAAAILEDPDIRQELNTIIAATASGPVGRTVPDLMTFLEEDILSTRAGAAVMGPVIEQAHDRIIGNRDGDDERVELTGDDMIPIVRDERAAEAATVTLPINPIGTLSTARTVTGWLIPLGAAIALLAIVLGVITRPERRDIVRGIGEFALALAVSMIVFGYLIPVHLLTAIDNTTWARAIPLLALRTLPVVLGSAAIFAVGGALLVLSSHTGGKRRQWSTPLSVARYQGGDNPGWG